jgi:hypothetical protein
MTIQVLVHPKSPKMHPTRQHINSANQVNIPKYSSSPLKKIKNTVVVRLLLLQYHKDHRPCLPTDCSTVASE